MKKRPFWLVAIALYKLLVALLFMVTSIALFLALKNSQLLHNFSDNYVLEGKAKIINWLLDKILNLNPKTLAFSSFSSGIYAIITTIEAIGLWYEKRWAHILVLCLIGFSITPEVYELMRGMSPIKLALFSVNAAVFWYLLHNFPKNSN